MTHKYLGQSKNRDYIDLSTCNEESTENDESSTDNSDSEYSDPEWLDNVKDTGDLFYVGSTLPTLEQVPETNSNTFKDRNASGDTGNVNKSGKKAKKKRSDKLKSLIKASKVLKNVDLGPREVTGAEDSSNVFETQSKVTFQQASGEMRDVLLDVDPGRHNYGRRASLCEVLFGIIPGCYHNNFNGDANHKTSNNDERIMVRGLIPDGEAMCCEDIKIGDWLRSVNNVEVTFLNINSVLSTISSSSKVKLVVQSPNLHILAEELKGNQPHQKSKLAKLVSCNNPKEEQESFLLHNSTNCIVLYLSLDGISELSSGKQDVLYQFPCDNKLVHVRGMFVTLSHTLPEITSCNPISSSVVCDEKLIHVGYAQEGNKTFVLALPDDCICVNQLHHLITDVIQLLKFQYKSLYEAFSKEENKFALDQLFLVILQQHLSQQKETGNWKQQPNGFTLVNNSFKGAQWLPLSPHIQMEIHNILNEFEAADFVDLSDDYYDVQRTYTILGTCIFYRGYLLANHLPKEDMLDILLFLKFHGLIMLTNQESLSRIVIWKEVFPFRRHNSNANAQVVETSGRWFLMIVGLKQYLLPVLLEAGGCTVNAEGKPGPDPFYVNQAEATLAQLSSLQIAETCEACLSTHVSSLANVDWFMQTSKINKDDASRGQEAKPSLKSSAKKSYSDLSSILKKSNMPFVTGSNSAVYDNESDTSNSLGTSSISDEAPMMAAHEKSRTSGSDVDSRESSETTPYKSTRRSRTLPGNSTIDLNSLFKNLPDIDRSLKLTTGFENTLFHYIHMNSADGVFVSSCENDTRSMLSAEVMENFHAASLLIQQQFQNTIQQKEMIKSKSLPQLGLDDSLTGVKEQGVLFQCSLPTRPNQKKPFPTLSYWVVGRLFDGDEPQEFYVCFLDSVPQNIIELAFKLGFGITV